MSENTTPWVRSKIKPEKPGWYERLYRTEPPVTVVHRCYWDGMYWSLPDDEAHRSSDQDMRWRPIPDACEKQVDLQPRTFNSALDVQAVFIELRNTLNDIPKFIEIVNAFKDKFGGKIFSLTPDKYQEAGEFVLSHFPKKEIPRCHE